jgi:hypothetical protein
LIPDFDHGYLLPDLDRFADYERMMATMKAGFMRQGNEGIVKARAVEDQLMRDSWLRADDEVRRAFDAFSDRRPR